MNGFCEFNGPGQMGFPAARLSLMTALAVGLWVPAVAQERQPPPAAADAGDAAAASAVADDEAGLLLRTPDGKLIPLRELLDPQLIEELVNRAQQQTEIPLFDVSRLELSASVDDNIVTMSVELTVAIRPESEWVAVPIALSEVHVTQIEHATDAADGRAVPDLANPAERRWYLYGRGIHTIRLELITRTRPTPSGGHQLSLSLPPATQSRVQATFQDPVDLKNTSPDSVMHVSRQDGGVSELELWGLPPQFSLQWSDVVQEATAQPSLRVQNRMLLDLTTVPILLTGSQTVQVTSAPVEALSLQFPPGYQLLELDVRSQADISLLNDLETTSTADGQVADIALTSPTEGVLTLTWDLELLSAPFPRDVLTQIPRVAGAALQNGDLDILIPPGLLVQQAEVSGAQRKRVATETGSRISATAFRLRSPESRIVLSVDEIEALYTVSPELVLEPDLQNAVMTVRFPLNVLRGSLLDVEFHWPGFTTGIWQLLPRSARLVTASAQSPISLEQSAQDGDAFSLRFPERQSGQFTVEFQAFAPLDQLQTDEAVLVCPEIKSESVQPVVITTIDSDAFTLLPLDATSGNPLRPLPGRPPTESERPGQAVTSWLVERASDRVRFFVNSQAPSVTASVQAALEDSENGIAVEETISYRIEHRDLAAVSLLVPDGIQPVVRLADATEPLRGTVDGTELRTYRLTEPQRGDLTLEVRYLVPVTETDRNGSESRADLPLVIPRQADVSRVEIGTSSMMSLRVEGSGNWQPVFSERFGTAWSAVAAPTSVTVRWNSGTLLHPSEAPSVILARTTVMENSLLTTTTALWTERPDAVRVLVPGSLSLQDVVVDGQSVRDGLLARRISGTTDVMWTVPTAGKSGTATDESPEAFAIEFRTRQQVRAGTAWTERTRIDRPRFSETPGGMTILHWVSSPDSLQIANADDAMLRLSDPPIVPAMQSATLSAMPRIDAIASTQPDVIRAAIRDYSDSISTGAAVVFYSAGVERPLSLHLIPAIPLLLVSASVCLLSFLLLIVLSRLRLVTFVMLMTFGGVIAWALLPAWSVILGPYVVVGMLFGLVAVVFQRMTSERQSRVLRSPHPLDLPTVFGFSDVIRTGSGVAPTDSSLVPNSRNDIPA